METQPSRSSVALDDNENRSPLRKMAEKNVRKILSRTKLGAKLSVDEHFDMVNDAISERMERKRHRETSLPHLLSPRRKQHRPISPSVPPVAYRPPQTLPPRLDSIPVPPTPPKSAEPAAIPLPASPPKSASSWLAYPPQSADPIRPGTPLSGPSRGLNLTQPRSRGQSHPPRSPGSPDIFGEFDKLFADFPHPPSASLRSPHSLPTPALSTGTASSYTTASGHGHGHSRPTTPASASAPDPARLESAINTLSQVILCLQGTQADNAAYVHSQADLEARLKGTEGELEAVRGENARIEAVLRRERMERTREDQERESERRGMQRKISEAEEETVSPSPFFPSLFTPQANIQTQALSALQAAQAASQTSAQTIQNLQSHLSASQSRCTSLESRTHTLEAEISRLNGAFDLVKDEYKLKEDDMRRRMEEAEFMHLALKESGARLGRELEGARKKYSELEKKGRGGFI